LGWFTLGRPAKKTDRSRRILVETDVRPAQHLSQVHATAVVSSEANISPGVRIGPYAVVEGPVAIGPDCEIGPHVHLVGPLVLGQGNRIGTGTVIGTEPQHLGYKGEPTRTEIGEFNTFREHVTIHRGSHVAGHGTTRIGSHNYFMAHSHVAHDCKVANHCILANGAVIGGHCEIHDRVFLSGNTAIHQFVRMGRLSLMMGLAGVGKDVVPFITVKNRITVAGVNVLGMRRAGISSADITTVRKACHILYRSDLLLKDAVRRLEDELGSHPLVAEMLQFIRESKRGIMRSVRPRGGEEEE
jgi:UDP-N-acetylglucosamine acyltransferase